MVNIYIYDIWLKDMVNQWLISYMIYGADQLLIECLRWQATVLPFCRSSSRFIGFKVDWWRHSVDRVPTSPCFVRLAETHKKENSALYCTQVSWHVLCSHGLFKAPFFNFFAESLAGVQLVCGPVLTFGSGGSRHGGRHDTLRFFAGASASQVL